MSRWPLWRHQVSARGITWRWLALVLAAWLVVGSLAHVGLPRVDPRLEDEQRPLESLATLALSASALVHAAPLRGAVGWLRAISPRRTRLGQAMWTLAHGLGGAVAGSACLLVVLPSGVPLRPVLTVWAAVWALTATLMTLALPRAAAAVPLALLAAHSFGGLVPWRANLVYNASLDRSLLAVAALLCALAIAASALAPRPRW